MFSIAIGDNTTAIDSLNTIADDKAVYYDLHFRAGDIYTGDGHDVFVSFDNQHDRDHTSL